MNIKIYKHTEILLFDENFDCEIAMGDFDFTNCELRSVRYMLFFDNQKIYEVHDAKDAFYQLIKPAKIYRLHNNENNFEVYKQLSFPISIYNFDDRLGSKFEVTVYLIVEIDGKTENNFFTVSRASMPINITVDLRSIKFIKTTIGKDSSWLVWSDTVYYAIPYCPEVKRHIKTRADYKTARVPDDFLWDQFLCDKHHVYRRGKQLKDVDPDSFKVLNRVFAKDRNHVFTSYGNAKVLDPASFEVLDSENTTPFDESCGYGRDCKHVYWFSCGSSTTHASIVRACHKPDTFLSVGDGFGIDDDFAYLEGKKLPKSRAKHWQKINNKFSKDDKHVYFLDRTIHGANPSTFIHVCDSFSKDDRSVFCRENTLSKADAQHWRLFTGTDYSKTNEHVYYDDKILPVLYLPSFEVLSDAYAKDANFVYCWGEIIRGADPQSFCLISSLIDDYEGSSSHGVDKFSLYYLRELCKNQEMLAKFSYLIDELRNKYP